MNDEIKTKCGYAAVIGRPNVGKSTLLNRILDTKLSIVTSKPQTTRNRVLAVYNQADSQVVFLDTPGIHRPTGSLGRYMNEAAEGAISEADICVWIIDATNHEKSDGLTHDELEVAERINATKTPTICLLNKVDLLRDKQLLLPLIQAAAAIPGVVDTIPVCALDGDGVDVFLKTLIENLPEAPLLFPTDMLSDRAERFFVAELVREALTDLTRQEVPYKSAVVVEKFVEEPEICVIHATIHVERASQKGIIIGKGGSMIKAIGARAREEAEKMLRCPVDLRLHVDVEPGWTKGPSGLRKMGYE